MGKRSGNTVFFIVKDKFVTLLLPSSSWLLKHPNDNKNKELSRTFNCLDKPSRVKVFFNGWHGAFC